MNVSQIFMLRFERIQSIWRYFNCCMLKSSMNHSLIASGDMLCDGDLFSFSFPIISFSTFSKIPKFSKMLMKSSELSATFERASQIIQLFDVLIELMTFNVVDLETPRLSF